MLNNKVEINEIIKIFKKQNLKVTPQRTTIYSYIISTPTHPNVDTIYKNIKPIIPTISLATVYKTINIFVTANLIKELNICEDNFRYDSNLKPHGHFRCNLCNTIRDIDLKNVVNINSINEYQIDSLDLLLYGKCTDCLNIRSSINI